jgi:hypothetical protein
LNLEEGEQTFLQLKRWMIKALVLLLMCVRTWYYPSTFQHAPLLLLLVRVVASIRLCGGDFLIMCDVAGVAGWWLRNLTAEEEQ